MQPLTQPRVPWGVGKASARSPPKPEAGGGHGSRRFAGLSLSPEPSTSNQNPGRGPDVLRRTTCRSPPPAAGSASTPRPRSRVEGPSVAGEAPAELQRRRAANARRRTTGLGPHSDLRNLSKRGVDGLTLAAPPRARGYPTLFPPSEGGGGFNVSRFSDSGRGTGAPAVVIHLNKPCQSRKLCGPLMCYSGLTPRVTYKTTKTLTTLSGGSLGSCVDEERS